MSHLATPRTMSSVLGQYCNAEVEQLPRSDSQLIVIFQFGFTGPQMREEIKNATSFSPNRSFNEQAVNLIFWHLLFGDGMKTNIPQNMWEHIAWSSIRWRVPQIRSHAHAGLLHVYRTAWPKRLLAKNSGIALHQHDAIESAIHPWLALIIYPLAGKHFIWSLSR